MKIAHAWSTSIIMKAFVITLERAAERQARFFAQAKEHGWEVEIFPAIDWRDLIFTTQPEGKGRLVTHVSDPAIHLEVLAPEENHAELTPGEIACALSHLQIWRKVLSEKLGHCFVFEDDASIEAAWEEVPLPEDAEFIFINDRVRSEVPEELSEESLDDWCAANPFSPMIPGCGLEAYIVTQAGAARGLEIMSSLRLPIDLQLFACGHGVTPVTSKLYHDRKDLPEAKLYATTTIFATHTDHAVSYIRDSISARRIQFGSGGTFIDGWINCDLPQHDIRKPLAIASESAEFLFAEHVIEHITPQEAWVFLTECMRILRPGGTVRLAFPDLKRILHAPQLYHDFTNRGGWGDGTAAGSVRGALFAHGHLGAWTADSMRTMLEAQGFTVTEHRPCQSDQAELRDLEQHWKVAGWEENDAETSIVEGLKPGAYSK
jgi:hypothetical protein